MTQALDLQTLGEIAAAAAVSDAERDAARAARAFAWAEDGEAAPALEALDLGGDGARLAELVSPEAALFIVAAEIGDRRSYEAKYRGPIWPGGASGVTIGFGYDLAHHAPTAIAEDWSALGAEATAALTGAAGLAGEDAQRHLRADAALQAVEIGWDAAMAVYERAELPKYAAMTARAFPGAERLPGHAFGALVSLVYNRGPRMSGANRLEMRTIRALLAGGRVDEIPDQIRAMKRIWAGRGLRGLLRRREAEALLFERGLAAASDGVAALESAGAPPAAPRLESREALAYQIGAVAAAAQGKAANAPRATSEGAEAPELEALFDVQFDLGFERLTRFGLGLLEDLERRLKRAVCSDLQLDDSFADLGDKVVAAAEAGRAGAGGGASTVQGLFAEAIKYALPILPSAICRSIAERVFAQVIEPLLGDAVEITRRRICQAWVVGAAATDGELEPPAAAEIEADPGPGLAPAHDLAAAQPAADEPAGVDAAATALLAAMARAPGALSPELRAALGARIGGGGPAGAAAEDVLILMRRVTGEAAGDDHGQVDDVALKQAVSDLRRALHAARAPLPRAAIVETLKALKSKKLFDHLSLLADAFIARDPDALSAVGSLYAQGLIDSGRLIAAYEVLERARAETEPRGVSAHPELYEIIGLMGRTQKQIYVNHVKTSGDASTAPEHIAEALQRAIAHYGEGARGVAGAPERPMARAHWHWVNYVALLTRAKADYRPTPPGEDAEALARRLIEALTREEGSAADDEDRRWRLASLGEAYLAVRDYDKAAQAFADYARLAKPFEISSTARQLEEVWRLQASLTGAGAILTNLKEAAARGGDVRLSADERRALSQGLEDADDLAFSAMFRETDTGLGKRMKAFVLRKIIDVCDAVCALQREDRGALRTMGTGFIIDGPALSPALSDGSSYLLTNAHVLWDPTLDDRPQRAPLTPANAVAAFENHRFDGRDERYRVARVLWQSPETECDAVLVELERKVAGLTPIQIAPGRPVVEMPLAVIGHPMGGDLTVALPGEVGKRQANLLDFGPKSPARTPLFLHYETATEPGNSGSPVLETDNWDVIGLHHAGFGGRGLLKLGGKPGYNKANEGVFIGSIAALIAAALAGGDQAADATAPDAAAAATAGAPAPSVLGRIFGAPAAPARAGLAFAEDVSLEDVDPEDVPPPEADALLETLAEAELWCPFAERGPSMRLRGPYAHRYPIGAVVHYTAGRFEKGAASARATMRYGAKSHAYFCIGADGAILQPGPLSHWGSHAGRSWRRGLLSDPTQDVYWLSRYLVGIEICGAGKVTRRGDVYAPYWNADFSASGTLLTGDQVREATKASHPNLMSEGPYHAYSPEQEAALRRLLVWLHLNNPAVFRIDNILGHDEIAVVDRPGGPKAQTLGRKTDPGGSLSVGMPRLRDEVRAEVRRRNRLG